MEAQREIVRTDNATYTISLPKWAVGHDVEVIILPVAMVDASKEDEPTPIRKHKLGPMSALGYAKSFRMTRTTDEWMRDLRAGEIS